MPYTLTAFIVVLSLCSQQGAALSGRSQDKHSALQVQNSSAVEGGLLQHLRVELEYELQPASPVKNKVVLAIIELVGLGFCGVDHCYMDRPLMGVIKGLTLGACGVWAFIDYVFIVYNCLVRSSTINVVSFTATFSDNTISPAFWITVVVLVLKVVSWCVKQCLLPVTDVYFKQRELQNSMVQVAQPTPEESPTTNESPSA